MSTSTPHCLVTGATGFTGSHLVRKLVSQGWHVRALARERSDISELSDLDIEWVRGEVYDASCVERAVDGVEYIFHLAAAYRAFGLPDEAYWNVHVKSTQLLARAAKENPNFKRFVHVSTIGVHSHIARPPADENYPFAPDDVYQKTKAEAEEWIRAFAKEQDFPLCVVRPAGIYGPGDKRLLKFFKLACKPLLLLLGPSTNTYHIIHVEDLANVLILTATHPKAVGEVFICGNAEPITYQAMGACIASACGRKCRPLRLPAGPFFIAADLCEWLCRLLGVPPPLSRRRVAFYTKNRAFDTGKMRRVLGYEPRSNESGLEETARWYQSHNLL